MAGQTGVDQARADMRELVEAARGRGAGRLFAWGGVAAFAFTAAFASWQYAPARVPLADTALATASIPPVVTGGAATVPNARQVGGRGITTVPGASDMTLLQRDVADLRQDLTDLRRGLTRYDVANEQIARRMEALEEQAAILASRMAQALEGGKPPPPGLPAATVGALPGIPPAASASVAPLPQAKPTMQKLEPALFDPRLGKIPPRPLTPLGEGKAAEGKMGEGKAADDKPEAAAPEKEAVAKAGAAIETKAAPSEAAEIGPAKPLAKEVGKDAAKDAKTAEPVVATAPMPVPPAPGPMTPPPSTLPIAATVRPAPTPAEEAQRAQRALQAAQVQQLAQQMILQQPGGKGLQLPLPTQSQLAAAAAVAKAEARADTTGSVPTATPGEAAVARTSFAVDLGGYKSLTALKKGWSATTAKHAGLTKSLTPLGQMKEAGNAVEARLIAGPFANAADAVKFCAQVQASGTACAPSVYVGQPLAP